MEYMWMQCEYFPDGLGCTMTDTINADGNRMARLDTCRGGSTQWSV